MSSPIALALALVVGLSLSAVALVAVAKRPQRGVLLLVALTPFNGLLLLVPHPTALDGWKEALVLLLAVMALHTPPAPRRQLPAYAVALIGLVGIGALSAVAVGGQQGLLGFKIDFFYVLLLPVLWRCPLSARDRDRLVTLLMVTGVVTAVVGLVQQVVGGAALAAIGYDYNTTIRTAGGLLRSFSTFNQPFPFGLYEMLVLLVGVPVALVQVRRRRNAAFLLCTPLLVAGMLSSIVRAAILGLLVGAVFLWWHRDRVLAHAVPIFLAAALFVPPSLYGPVLSPTSLGQRSAGWAETFGRVLAAPLGNGIGASGSAAEKTAAAVGTTALTYQPDNYYFKTVFELGPIGLWLLILILVSAFGMARRTSLVLRARASTTPDAAQAQQGRRDAALAAGIGAAILAAAAASVVATYFEIFPLDLLFWLLLGVLSSLGAGSSSTPSPPDPVTAASGSTSVGSVAH